MNLFAISDLHLSFGTDKPMNVFYGWDNYTDRIKANWTRCVCAEDTVVIAGDVSWASSFEQALPDFKFINSLPGKKIILKGNHDFWWGTASKINEFLKENNLDTIKILHNNYYTDGNIAICGSRGWLYDGSGAQDKKVINRECGRIEASIKGAVDDGKQPLLFLHYPPAYGEFVCEEIIEIIKKYNINQIYYGHIHGVGKNKSLSQFGDIKMKLISADCVDFTPIFITPCGTFN